MAIARERFTGVAQFWNALTCQRFGRRSLLESLISLIQPGYNVYGS
jgi:hypothetical protein